MGQRGKLSKTCTSDLIPGMNIFALFRKVIEHVEFLGVKSSQVKSSQVKSSRWVHGVRSISRLPEC